MVVETLGMERLDFDPRPLVQVAPPALEQRLIRRILDQGVLELVGRLGRDAARIDEFRVCELRQRGLQFRFAHSCDRVQQFVGELTSNHRRELRDLSRRSEPVQSGRE